MFVRFTKRKGSPDVIYRRAVAINGTYLIQEGDDIVAYAMLRNREKVESGEDKYPMYRIWVVDCNHISELERYVKRFIGNSGKWEHEDYRRRIYNVTYVEKEGFFNSSRFKVIRCDIQSICKTKEL